MTDINNIVIANFNNNIEYIKENHPKTFEKLAALDSAISNNHYKECYELTYENGYFDVFEKSTQTLLYETDSYKYSELAAQSVNYDTQENVFATFHKHDLSKDDVVEIHNDYKFKNHLSAFADILYYHQENEPADKHLKSLDKFIFFGVGLGLHIAEIDKQISSKVYFIIEDDLELFRLSLFTTNYKELAKNSTLILSIFEDKTEFINSSNSFLEQEYYYNHYIKYFNMLSHKDEKRKDFHLQVASQSHLSFFYNDILTQSLKPLDYMLNGYKFLKNSLSLSDKVLDKMPFLLLAAGPSLQKNLKWLKQNHNSFVIVTVSAVLSLLKKEDISPDIIIHLEGNERSSALFKKISSFDFIKNSICLFSDKVASNVIELFSQEKIFLFENGTKYKEESLKPSAPCVGSISYQILLALQVKNIYLLGLDLAVDSSGKTHIDEHIKSNTISLQKSTEDENIIKFDQDLVPIEGNFEKEVYTTAHFKSSIDTINHSTHILKNSTQTIYNLGNGAKFSDSVSIRADKIKISKNTLYNREYISDKIKKHITVGLSDIEIKNLNRKLSEAYKLKKIVLKLQAIKELELSDYLKKLRDMSALLLKDDNLYSYEIDKVLNSYFRYILTFIFDFFNSTELENIPVHTKYINSFFTKNLLNILDFYINSIEKSLNNRDKGTS